MLDVSWIVLPLRCMRLMHFVKLGVVARWFGLVESRWLSVFSSVNGSVFNFGKKLHHAHRGG